MALILDRAHFDAIFAIAVVMLVCWAVCLFLSNMENVGILIKYKLCEKVHGG